MKHVSAIVTALIITMVIGLGIMVVGVNALTNTNTVALQNSPSNSTSSSTTTGSNTSASSAASPSQMQQLQQQVTDLQSQLNQASQIIQQYQSLLVVLQQRGLIGIDQNGNIFLPQGNNTTSFH